MFKFKKKEKEVPKDISSLVDRINTLEEENRELKKEIEKIYQKQESFLQKIEVVRFNPFSDSGGNQSFSMALLDNSGNGAVITSLYSSEGNRVYAKPIRGGVSEYSLSVEEEKVIGKLNKDE